MHVLREPIESVSSIWKVGRAVSDRKDCSGCGDWTHTSLAQDAPKGGRTATRDREKRACAL